MSGQRWISALALAMVLATGLTACSDDGGGGSEDIVLEDIGDDTGSVEVSETTETTETTDDTTPDDTGASEVFTGDCEAFTSAFSALGASFTLDGGLDREAIGDFDEAIQDAPESIRDHLQVYADTLEEYVLGLEEAGVDPDDPSTTDAETAERIADLARVFTTPEFLAATEAINAFVSSGCET